LANEKNSSAIILAHRVMLSLKKEAAELFLNPIESKNNKKEKAKK